MSHKNIKFVYSKKNGLEVFSQQIRRQNFRKFYKLLLCDFIFLSGFSFTNIHESQDCGGREGISLIPHYHFHQLCRHLDISRAIAAESSTLHIVSRWTRQAYQDKFYVARGVYSVLTIVNSVSQYVFLYCEV